MSRSPVVKNLGEIVAIIIAFVIQAAPAAHEIKTQQAGSRGDRDPFLRKTFADKEHRKTYERHR